MTVKDIAQMLQSFGTQLAETELPDEGKATESLLECHTEKYRKLKVRCKLQSQKEPKPLLLEKDLKAFISPVCTSLLHPDEGMRLFLFDLRQ